MSGHLDLGAAIAALCRGGDVTAQSSIAVALLVAGLVGGFAHCGPMCAPFVLMQTRPDVGPGMTLRRLGEGTLPLYHLGRLITYSVLGAVAGGIGASFLALTSFHWALAALLALAALGFLSQALRGFFHAPGLPLVFGVRFGGAMARLAARIGRPRDGAPLGNGRSLLLGLVLGFLPCGFLYAALGAAAATGSASAGAVAMAAFGLGTVPVLAVVGVAGAAMAARWRHYANACLPAVFLINATILGGLALKLAT